MRRGLFYGRKSPAFFLTLLAILISGCITDAIRPTDVQIFRYHSEKHLEVLKEYISRLYEKNPRYQNDPVWRQKRLNQIFNDSLTLDKYAHQRSNEVLTEAFSEDPDETDRVYLLGLGLVKSIRETYGLDSDGLMITGLQLPLKRMQRLYFNLSQVNWRIKTYKDSKGFLLFKTNEAGENGYLNMGYEVLMTEILTRVEDDIYLRGGLPKKYIFSMSTLFVSLLL